MTRIIEQSKLGRHDLFSRCRVMWIVLALLAVFVCYHFIGYVYALSLAKKHHCVDLKAINAVKIVIGSKAAANALVPYLHFLDSRLLGCYGLSRLYAGGFNVSANQLEAIGQLDSVSFLSLANADIDDVDLKYLAHLDKLETLRLQKNPIQGEGLKYISDLSNLQHLRLSHTQIKGIGLEYLRNSETLRTLDLSHTQVDDSAIPYLKEIKSSIRINLSHTKVSWKGIIELCDMQNLIAIELVDEERGSLRFGDRIQTREYARAQMELERGARPSRLEVPLNELAPILGP